MGSDRAAQGREHRQRLVTGGALAALVVVLVGWAPGWLLALGLALAAGIGTREYLGLAESALGRGPAAFLAVLGGLVALAGLLGPAGVLGSLGLGLAAVALIAFASPSEPAERWTALSRLGFGLLYPGGLFACLLLLARPPQGRGWLFFLILCVAVADIGAFYTGHRLGRHKLAPAISPGKTLEGLAGGALAALLAGGAAALLGLVPASWPAGAALGLGLALVSVVGDLLESLLKRGAGAKDSGRLLPGHGGLLDRVDGLLLAGPLLLLYRALS